MENQGGRLTFSQFFQALEVIDLELSQTFVGRAKDRLDLVDSDLAIASGVMSLWKFITILSATNLFASTVAVASI